MACERLWRPRGEPGGHTGYEGSWVWQHYLHRRDCLAARRAEHGGVRSGKGGSAQSRKILARSLWPCGIHVALIVVDAVVDLPGTRRNMPDKPDSFFLKPDDMAASAVWLAQQPRSAWTFEIEVRPFGEKW